MFPLHNGWKNKFSKVKNFIPSLLLLFSSVIPLSWSVGVSFYRRGSREFCLPAELTANTDKSDEKTVCEESQQTNGAE